MTTVPAYSSALYLINPRIYHADRENNLYDEITDRILNAGVDADIDRQGPKAVLSLTTSDPNLVNPGTWIAPFLEVTPEGGSLVSSQLGLYRLDEPKVQWETPEYATAQVSGEDIITTLETPVLTRPQVSYRYTAPMAEARAAVELATSGEYGANLALNGTFTNGSLANWNFGYAGGTAVPSVGVEKLWTVANGYAARVTFPAGSQGVNAGVFNTLVPVPGDARRLVGEIFSWGTANGMMPGPYINFYDSSNTLISSGYEQIRTSPAYTANNWQRHLIHVNVPDGAATMQIVGLSGWDAGLGASGGTMYWYDAGIRRSLFRPLFRHAFPDDPRLITTKEIAHKPGVKWSTRVNDLLKAIGHHAVFGSPDGRPTSEVYRDVRDDEPATVYDLQTDTRIVMPVTTQRSTGNVYNVITAIKEDSQAGTFTAQTARNDNPNHPWSTVNIGERSPQQPITVNGAADDLVLQLVATVELLRSSEQQSVELARLPDPTLTLHKTFRINSPGRLENGNWAIEKIKWGLTGHDPLLHISGRRTLTYTEPEGS